MSFAISTGSTSEQVWLVANRAASELIEEICQEMNDDQCKAALRESVVINGIALEDLEAKMARQIAESVKKVAARRAHASPEASYHSLVKMMDVFLNTLAPRPSDQ